MTELNCELERGRRNIQEAFPGGSDGEESACNAGDLGSIPGLGLATHSSILGASLVAQTLEKGIATHSSILAWTSLCREEPGGPQSMGSQRVRCN